MYKNYEQCCGPPIPSVQAMRLKLWESHIGCASYNILKNQPNRRWSTVNVVLQASDFLRYLLLRNQSNSQAKIIAKGSFGVFFRINLHLPHKRIFVSVLLIKISKACSSLRD